MIDFKQLAEDMKETKGMSMEERSAFHAKRRMNHALVAAGEAPIPDAEPEPPEPPITLSDEQEQVSSLVVNNRRNVLITGSAGVGKSTLVKEIVRRCRAEGSELPCTGSTGIAAIQIGGMTMHSFFGLGLGDEPAAKIASIIRNREAVLYRLKNTHRVVIDEISMISSDLLNKLDAVLKIVRKSEEPFGGMQIVACGDFLQLPPVQRGESRAGKFAFQSEAWKAGKFHVAMLTKVFRQADEEFSGALNDIRVGNVSPRARKILESRFKQKDPEPDIEPITIHTTNKDVDHLNAERLAQLEGEEKEWTAHDTGEDAQVKNLQKNCLAPTVLTLKVGAQVMLLKNISVEGGLANGSMGKVIAMDKPEGPTIEFRNGAKLILPRAKWEVKINGTVLATRWQIPLRLAWAITSHRSQGMTLDKIRVHLGNVFEEGQAYVALSRARTAEGLFIESSAQGCIRANRDAVEFYRRAQGC